MGSAPKLSMKNKKLKIFIDADDTMLLSSETVIDIINRRYDISPPKDIEDLKDWNYKSISEFMTAKEVYEIYDSDEFFENVKPHPVFVEIYHALRDELQFIAVTKGKPNNLSKKEKLLKKLFPEMEFIGLPILEEGREKFDKSSVDMSRGVQIDDRISCLKTNASVKILLKNGHNLPWNRYRNAEVGTLYVAENFEDIRKILFFLKEHKDVFLGD